MRRETFKILPMTVYEFLEALARNDWRAAEVCMAALGWPQPSEVNELWQDAVSHYWMNLPAGSTAIQ